jgi:S1-C subfamily serine protease
LIVGVMPDSAAERAGLCPTRRSAAGEIILGDVILAADGKPVQSNGDLLRILDTHDVGDTLPLTIKRDDDALNLDIQLQALQ